MNRRLSLGVLALAALALSAGCLGLGTGPVPADQLDQAPADEYAWDADTDVHITIQDNARFRGVYQLNGSEIELFRRDGFGGRNPLSVSAVRYQYPNGTVINGSDVRSRGGEITRTRDVVRVTLPPGTSDGRLAFTADSTPKRFTLPTFVKGSYELVLPPNRRIDFFLFATVSPRGYDQTTVGTQTHLRWTDVTTNTLVVQFYLQRDLYVFAAALVLLGIVGGGGTLYYRRQLEALREQREELGLSVEQDDDEFDRGPPPGMR